MSLRTLPIQFCPGLAGLFGQQCHYLGLARVRSYDFSDQDQAGAETSHDSIREFQTLKVVFLLGRKFARLLGRHMNLVKYVGGSVKPMNLTTECGFGFLCPAVVVVLRLTLDLLRFLPTDRTGGFVLPSESTSFLHLLRMNFQNFQQELTANWSPVCHRREHSTIRYL